MFPIKKTEISMSNEVATSKKKKQWTPGGRRPAGGGLLRRIKNKTRGTSAIQSSCLPVASESLALPTHASAQPSATLLANKAIISPGRRIVDGQQFILHCMKEAGYITGVQEKDILLRHQQGSTTSTNLIQHEDPQILNYPAALDVLVQGSIVGLFDLNNRLQHCMIVVASATSSGTEILLAGVSNRAVLHPSLSSDRRYAGHAAVSKDQLKKLQNGTTVRYQSLETVLKRVLSPRRTTGKEVCSLLLEDDDNKESLEDYVEEESLEDYFLEEEFSEDYVLDEAESLEVSCRESLDDSSDAASEEYMAEEVINLL